MKTKSLIFLTFISLLFLSGCGSRPKASYTQASEKQLADIKISNGAGYPSWSANEANAFRDALETAARVTLHKEYKYFAIVTPQDMSNLKGSIKNTAEEALDYCSPSGFLALNINGSGLHKCGTFNTMAKMRIILYNEEQVDFVVYDAQDIIDYYRTEGIYDGDDIEYLTEEY